MAKPADHVVDAMHAIALPGERCGLHTRYFLVNIQGIHTRNLYICNCEHLHIHSGYLERTLFQFK